MEKQGNHGFTTVSMLSSMISPSGLSVKHLQLCYIHITPDLITKSYFHKPTPILELILSNISVLMYGIIFVISLKLQLLSFSSVKKLVTSHILNSCRQLVSFFLVVFFFKPQIYTIIEPKLTIYEQYSSINEY